jgi:hypothetical protein
MHDDLNCQQQCNTSGARAQGGNVTEHGGRDLLDAGLQAARRGWKIFICKSDKTPIGIKHWKEEATRDELTISRWAKQYPGGLWARALEADVVILDLDIKNGKNGPKEFEHLQGCQPAEFAAPQVATATGGVHIHTDAKGRDYQNTVSRIAPGIDTKTAGGYVIIPSGPKSGYRWLSDPDTPLPEAPAWADVAIRRISNLEGSAAPGEYQCSSPYGQAILKSACEAIAAAPGGKQEVTLNGRSYQIGRYVGGGLLDHEPTVNDLIRAGLRMVDYNPRDEWTEAQIDKKVKAAVEAGMKKPLDGEEPFRAMREVHERFLASPELHAAVEQLLIEEEAKRKSQETDPEVVPMHGPTQDEPRQDEPGQEQPKQEDPKPQEKMLIRRLGRGVPAPVPFCVAELVHERGTGIFASKYFNGKTFVAMSLAASIATGESFAGRNVLRRGAALWLAAEGEWEVDKRARAAIKALNHDPDNQPLYVQTFDVPKLAHGEHGIMKLVRQAERLAREEFDVPLVLVVIDTMIKAAGYKKSESDSVEVNRVILAMDNIAFAAKCFVLALDHMGKNEELGARGSSDKPSSVDLYAEIKINGSRTFHVIKVKGEKGDEQVDFQIVGTVLDNGQKTAYVKWGKWREQDQAFKALNGNARLLLGCVSDLIKRKGQMRVVMLGEPDRRCVQKKDIMQEFDRRHKEHTGSKRHDTTFKRSWGELVGATLITMFNDEAGVSDLDKWVYLEKSYE